jgi:hypothetical protein
MTAARLQQQLRWLRGARHALTHSLRVRLVALFLLLALAMAVTFVIGMQTALSIGWRDAARPLVMDYVDQLANEIGSPPSLARAQALVQRLPLSVRISGPVVNWRSNPNEPDHAHDERQEQGQGATESSRWGGDAPRFFERNTPDGHNIRFGLNVQAWQDRPRFIGWATLAAMRLGHQLAQVQAQTHTATLPGAGSIGAVEGLGQQADLRFGDARPVVANQNKHRSVSLPGHRQLHRLGAASVVAQRVAQQIAQEQTHAHWVPLQQGQTGVQHNICRSA